MNKINKPVTVYLDLLGFSNFIKTDLEGALELINTYHITLNFMLNESHKFKSFVNLIPFSDSIFIQGENNHEFYNDLAEFLLTSFLYHSSAYMFPEDITHPEKVTIKHLQKINGNLAIGHYKRNWHPTLFKGGISFGDSFSINILGIKNKRKSKYNILFGLPVVEAVKLESNNNKGPRIFISSYNLNFIDQELHKIFFRSFDDPNLYELYWPIITLRYDNIEMNLNNEFNELLLSSINLWKAYNHLPGNIPNHYYNFIKLIVLSIINYYMNSDNQQKLYLLEELYKILNLNGISGKFSDLLSVHLC